MSLVTNIGIGQEHEISALVRTATVDPDNMADAADSTKSVTVTDVEIGDAVIPIAPYDGQGIIVNAVASAANTVDVNFYNASGGAVNFASGTWTFLIFKTGKI